MPGLGRRTTSSAELPRVIADGASPTGVATLTLTDLPAHTSVDLSFLLAIIDTWDGSGSGAAAAGLLQREQWTGRRCLRKRSRT